MKAKKHSDASPKCSLQGVKDKAMKGNKNTTKNSVKTVVAVDEEHASSSLEAIFTKLKSTKSDIAAKPQPELKQPRKLSSSAEATDANVGGSATSDGLYRDRGATVEMDDAEFFANATNLKKRNSKSGKASSKPHSVKDTQGLNRVVTEDEIMKLTSHHNAAAGTTPNCPFDCDCCF